MSFGDSGNGFDFLIDPFRHGGMPATRTSVPYPTLAEESFDARVEGAFDVVLLQNLESIDVSSVALSGAMRSLLQVYNEGPEKLDSLTAQALSGLMAQVLKVYSEGPESVDSVSVALDGTMEQILIVIQMEVDSFNGVVAVATGGTMQ